MTSRRLAAKDKRREEHRRREQIAEREQQRDRIRRELADNEANIRRGENINVLSFVIHQYIELFHSAGLGDLSGDKFVQDYGLPLWEAAKEGFQRFWRITEPPSRTAVQLGSVPDIALAALVGIALDIEQGYDVASESTTAARLAHYATWK